MGAVRAVAAACLLGGVSLVLAAFTVAAGDTSHTSSEPARPASSPAASAPAGAQP